MLDSTRPPNTHGHTPDDYLALTAAGIDPGDTQPREHDTRCFEWGCHERTFNQAGGCRWHYRAPAVVTRVLAAS